MQVASVATTAEAVTASERGRVHLPAVTGLRVVSEGAHRAALEKVARRRGPGKAHDEVAGIGRGERVRRATDVPVVATLRAGEGRAPENPVPRPDVFVEVDGAVVGLFPTGYAPMWHATLARAAEAEVQVTADAVVRRHGTTAALSLRLVGPEHLRLMLSAPAWAIPLVPECSVTLSGAQVSEDTLARVTRRMVDWVTLHPAVIEEGRHAGEPGIEVRLEGEKVGEFSAATSARYRQVVDAAGAEEKVALARARLRYGRRGDIEVLLPRPVR